MRLSECLNASFVFAFVSFFFFVFRSRTCVHRLSGISSIQKVRCTAAAVLHVHKSSLWVKLKPQERVSSLAFTA